MGISRLVYGRSAMQGLYLNPDAWYEERRITAWLNTRALRDRPRRSATVAARHGGDAGLRPRDPRHRLEQPRAADRGLRRARHRGAALGRRRDRRCARSPSARRPASPRSPAAACSASRPRTRCTRSASRRWCSSAPTGCSSASSTPARRTILRNYLEGPRAWGSRWRPRRESVDANGRLRGVTLTDGRRLEAHILLVAAGIRPNVDLAQGRGPDGQARRARRRPHAHRRPARCSPRVTWPSSAASCPACGRPRWRMAEVAADTVAGRREDPTRASCRSRSSRSSASS